MKKFKIAIAAVLLVALIGLQGCSTQKDCRGKTKHKLNNGIWM